MTIYGLQKLASKASALNLSLWTSNTPDDTLIITVTGSDLDMANFKMIAVDSGLVKYLSTAPLHEEGDGYVSPVAMKFQTYCNGGQ